ncbi:MAG: YwiC-like family protein [Deinococcales bacterium]
MVPGRSKVRWRTLALPNEHGAWAFLLEPALLGLGLAPSAPGVALVGAGLGALLTQHPLGLAMADLCRGKRFPRTLPALGLAAVYATASLLSLAAAFALGAHAAALLPLAPALLIALVQLAFDARNRGRAAPAELAGALALGALAAAIVLAAGGPWSLALALWLVAAGRNVPSVLYVRARLRLQRGGAVARGPVVLAHVVALAAVTLACWRAALPWLALAPFAVLLARAAVGLRRGTPALQAKTVGMREMGFGLMTVAAVLVGVWAGW